MKINPILSADSYKASHFSMYPAGTTAQYSYIEARKSDRVVIPFGLTMAIKKYLLQPITYGDIIEAEELLTAHGLPFNKEGWAIILDEYNGYLPLSIHAVKEGTVTESRAPLVVIQSTDSRLFWLPSYIETWLQREFWYCSTIASNDYQNYLILKDAYDKSSDNVELLQFALHDFGARGVSSEETAAMGGLAHLLYFRGTDNLTAIRAARAYYDCKMAGYSITATEHSIQCAFGDKNQLDYITSVISTMQAGDIASIVLDGYDIYRDTELLCTHFKHIIKDKGIKVVIRPDSGNPFEIIPKLLNVIEYHFGSNVNSKGFKVLNNVSLIQGDGIDTAIMSKLVDMIFNLGYAAETLVYGSGGGLLQKVNRDTYSFAQKTSAMEINGGWIDTVKNPVTDPGKRSKGGKLDTSNMALYYYNGDLLVNDSLDTIRLRATAEVK